MGEKEEEGKSGDSDSLRCHTVGAAIQSHTQVTSAKGHRTALMDRSTFGASQEKKKTHASAAAGAADRTPVPFVNSEALEKFRLDRPQAK